MAGSNALRRLIIARSPRVSAEQILRTGNCSALVLWQNHIRAESLRRLLLV